MLELSLKAHRGSFQLEVDCTFASQWSVIFGPSGAGKSTLLRLIAGLERPDRGVIKLDDKTLFEAGTKTGFRIDVKPGSQPVKKHETKHGTKHETRPDTKPVSKLAQRSVAMVAQQPALFPHLNVAANVAYGLNHLSKSAQSQRVAEMLTLVGAFHLANRSPRKLSGGEAQRVSLARALAPGPRLILLDEPLSALDGQARDETLSRVQSWLSEQNIQAILVTHDAADALETRAEVFLMSAGKMTAQGPAHEVLADERQRLLVRLNATP